MFKYFPHTANDIKEMLDVIGVKSLDDLYAEIPEELKFKGELNLPSAMSESDVRRQMRALSGKNKLLVCFAGQGAYDHYTPSVIPYIASRSEFSTSYTPYQAEISQGTLQYIFEYQTMMCRLTGMDVSNASMYDGSTATAEAMMMCVAAAKKRNKVVISDTFLPAVMDVVKTYAHYHGVELIIVAAKDGVTDLERISDLLNGDDVAGVIVPQPNRYGIIENYEGLADACHSHKALLVINTMASVLGVLRTPGEWGADIACGDAQSLGIPLNYGGPYIGYLCTRTALIRKMPGRLVGQTIDTKGQRCFVLTMQAREQHIRREKATSNICTAQGYMCLFVACYLSLMGEKGLREVNEKSYANAHLLHEKLLGTGLFEEAFPDKPFMCEFTLRLNSNKMTASELHNLMAQHGYLAGAVICEKCGMMAFAATEERTEEEINVLVKLIKEVAS
ncbi:MAG: aminomethyl-transferring glycine dehydrogenase subunit GcvPA [Bacteroidaceae bacterium]|nr:aminomethyl-transferring glycine dehydrogenase subunit GcvPA [Bacteroidaceae bacterium]